MAVPTGTVTVVDTLTSTRVASGPLDSTGNASLSWLAAPGTYNFVVGYDGDPIFLAGKSAAIPYLVNAAQQNVTVNASVAPPSPANAGDGVVFTIGVVAG